MISYWFLTYRRLVTTYYMYPDDTPIWGNNISL